MSVSNDELVTAPVLITAVWKIPADDDGDLPAPEEHSKTHTSITQQHIRTQGIILRNVYFYPCKGGSMISMLLK